MRFQPRDDDFESFLADLNRSVSTMPPSPMGSPHPSVQIVGLPRSGTTVLYQLLARSGAVGYPSNVMAFFHQEPWVGARLQQQLSLSVPTLTLRSIGGRTREPLDPHEFGYFWRRVCGHTTNSLVANAGPFDPAALQQELDRVSAVFGAPTVYKNYLALTHAARMRTEMERMKFVLVERDGLAVATSLLELRHRLDMPESDPLIGVQPQERIDPALGVPDRVARQVVALEGSLGRSGLEAGSDVLRLRFDDLVEDPRAAVGEILRWLQVPDVDLVDRIPARLDERRGSSYESEAADAIARARSWWEEEYA